MIRRWVLRRCRQAHADWVGARNAYHAVTGTPLEQDGSRYLEITARRFHRWDTIAILIGAAR